MGKGGSGEREAAALGNCLSGLCSRNADMVEVTVLPIYKVSEAQ